MRPGAKLPVPDSAAFAPCRKGACRAGLRMFAPGKGHRCTARSLFLVLPRRLAARFRQSRYTCTGLLYCLLCRVGRKGPRRYAGRPMDRSRLARWNSIRAECLLLRTSLPRVRPSSVGAHLPVRTVRPIPDSCRNKRRFEVSDTCP